MTSTARTRRSIVLAAALVGGCQIGTPQPTAMDQYVAGVTFLKNGDEAAAIRELEGAVAKNPDLRMARTVLGQIYRNRGEYANAARQYEALARLDRYTVANHYYLGVSYQFLRRYADAVRAYLVGLSIDPDDFKSNMNVGTVLLATGDMDSSVRYLQKATQLDPKSASAWSNLGVALDARGEYAHAEDAYRHALNIEANTIAVVQNLANNLLLQQKVGEATYLWQEVVKQKPTSFNRTKLADAYTQGGDLKSAEAIIDAILKVDPRFVPGLNARARVQIRRYELSGFTDDAARRAGLATIRLSLSLNGEQPAMAQLAKKYAQALPLAQ